MSIESSNLNFYMTEYFYSEPSLCSLFCGQSYDVNLQVTSVVSRLAMMPHPNLHEYLLNPLLPSGASARTLTTVVRKVSYCTLLFLFGFV